VRQKHVTYWNNFVTRRRRRRTGLPFERLLDIKSWGRSRSFIGLTSC